LWGCAKDRERYGRKKKVFKFGEKVEIVWKDLRRVEEDRFSGRSKTFWKKNVSLKIVSGLLCCWQKRTLNYFIEEFKKDDGIILTLFQLKLVEQKKFVW